jgi:hypothetical protein
MPRLARPSEGAVNVAMAPFEFQVVVVEQLSKHTSSAPTPTVGPGPDRWEDDRDARRWLSA